MEPSVKYLTDGLNGFHGANLTLSSDVDQEMFGLNEKPPNLSMHHIPEHI